MQRNRNIILIGGAPTTGKSTIAKKLAEKMQVPWISTDQIRTIMRVTALRSDFPKLFNPEGYDGERFLTEFTANQIATMEMEQAEATWRGVKEFIEQDYTWSEGFVVEGVNILPHLVEQDFKMNHNVKAVFLGDDNKERIRRVVYERGLWGDADTYPDAVKPKEVEWTLLFNSRIRAEANRLKYPFIEVTKTDADLRFVLDSLVK